MIRKWILHLREQPRHMKSHVAFIGAGVVTSIIALVWMTTVPARFESVSNIADVVPRDSAALLQDALSPALEQNPSPKLSEEETLRAKVDTLLEGLGSEKKSVRENTATPREANTKPTPILIETTTTTKKESSGTRTILIATTTSS